MFQHMFSWGTSPQWEAAMNRQKDFAFRDFYNTFNPSKIFLPKFCESYWVKLNEQDYEDDDIYIDDTGLDQYDDESSYCEQPKIESYPIDTDLELDSDAESICSSSNNFQMQDDIFEQKQKMDQILENRLFIMKDCGFSGRDRKDINEKIKSLESENEQQKVQLQLMQSQIAQMKLQMQEKDYVINQLDKILRFNQVTLESKLEI